MTPKTKAQQARSGGRRDVYAGVTNGMVGAVVALQARRRAEAEFDAG